MPKLSNVQPRASKFSLNISINGLPLWNGSRQQFWPMLINIYEMPEVPALVIGNFCGETKPNSTHQYLRPLVDELNELQQNGIDIANKLIEVRVRAFIADPVARTFIKGVASFSHINGCQKCIVQGLVHNTTRGTYFPGIDAPPRTDAHFRALAYGDHHTEQTPLLDLHFFNMIKNVTTADLLHLVDYGVTRMMVNSWKSGKLGRGGKWSPYALTKINRTLENVEIPFDFHRKLRSIQDTDLWQASEFNVFLNYASFIVLKDVLPEEEYNHFMLYYCAIRMFSSHSYKEHWQTAHTMLKQFVLEYGIIYGKDRLTSIVHNLLHLYDD
uniref:Uncharacterized protein n=1 Tax=Anopheles epiroticus TaxID=199890 RepID=A0A182PTJ6_9DIPT